MDNPPPLVPPLSALPKGASKWGEGFVKRRGRRGEEKVEEKKGRWKRGRGRE